MGPGIPLVMAALGLIAFATSTKSAKAAPGSAPGSTPGGPGPQRPEFQNIPLPLLQEMAKVVQELTVTDFDTSPDGSVVSSTILGPVTKEAIQKATSLAAKLAQSGFSTAAKTIGDLAKLASGKLPSPPAANQIPLPVQCFSSSETESLNRLVAVERDPVKLQAVLDALKTRSVPPECAAQVKVFMDMLSALVTQAQAKINDEEAIRKTQEILKTGTLTSPGQPTGPLNTNPAPMPPGFQVPPPGVVPSGVTPRVTIVQSGDGFARITKRLLGSDARWVELRDRNVPVDADGRKRAKDTAAKGGIKPMLNPGNKLFVPESWSVAPGIQVPASLPPLPQASLPSLPTVTPASTTVGPRVTVVKSGDGFFRIAQRLGVDGNRWPELRDRNVPVDADGRARAKWDASKGGIKPQLNPGNKLFVPESWPVTSVAGVEIGYADDTQALVEKSPVEMAAEQMCSHLNRLLAKHPNSFEKVKAKCDKRVIARFQKLCGLPPTATVTPSTLLKAAELGQTNVPIVLSWPENVTAELVNSYRMVIAKLAAEAKERGDEQAHLELSNSAKREHGQSAGL